MPNSIIIQYYNKATKHWYMYQRKERKVLDTRTKEQGPWARIPKTSE